MMKSTKEFAVADWPDLEHMVDGKCPCCGEQFNEDMRPELTSKCHKGPVFVSYWDGWLYMECGKCRKPICCVPVDKSLLPK